MAEKWQNSFANFCVYLCPSTICKTGVKRFSNRFSFPNELKLCSFWYCTINKLTNQFFSMLPTFTILKSKLYASICLYLCLHEVACFPRNYFLIWPRGRRDAVSKNWLKHCSAVKINSSWSIKFSTTSFFLLVGALFISSCGKKDAEIESFMTQGILQISLKHYFIRVTEANLNQQTSSSTY